MTANNSQLLLGMVERPMRCLSSRSPLPSDEHPQKKRPFVRKPCVSPPFMLADKKRKESFRELPPKASAGDNLKKTSNQEETSQTKTTDIGDPQLVKSGQDESSVAWSKEMFFQPCSSQNDLLSQFKYIQRNSFNLNRKDLQADFSTQKEGSEMEATTDRSFDSLLQNCKSSNAITVRPPNIPIPPSSKDKSPKILPGSKVPMQEKWCVNCRTNKQKCQILSEKCSKLEEQLELRNRTIKELNERLEQAKSDKAQNETERQQLIGSNFQLREILEVLEQRAYQSQQDFSHTFESAKKEIQKLSQRLKYMQMENTMLLRYKQEYGMIGKECDKLRYDNDHLKRQLNNIARMDSNFDFTKKSKMQTKTPIGTDRHKSPKGITPLISKDEETISLNLSEWSVQQF